MTGNRLLSSWTTGFSASRGSSFRMLSMAVWTSLMTRLTSSTPLWSFKVMRLKPSRDSLSMVSIPSTSSISSSSLMVMSFSISSGEALEKVVVTLIISRENSGKISRFMVVTASPMPRERITMTMRLTKTGLLTDMRVVNMALVGDGGGGGRQGDGGSVAQQLHPLGDESVARSKAP